MTAHELSVHMAELGLKPGQMARLFGITPRQISVWRRDGLDEGAGGAQAAVARSLRLLRRLPQRAVLKTINAVLLEQLDATAPAIDKKT